MSCHDGFSAWFQRIVWEGEIWEENFYREMLNVQENVLQDVLKKLKKDSKLSL